MTYSHHSVKKRRRRASHLGSSSLAMKTPEAGVENNHEQASEYAALDMAAKYGLLMIQADKTQQGNNSWCSSQQQEE
jgi:hypothetical protein